MFLTRKQLGSLGSSDCTPLNSPDSLHSLDSIVVRVNAQPEKEDTLPMLAEVNLVSQKRTVALALTQQECVVPFHVRASHGDLPPASSAVELEALVAHH